MKLPIYFSLIGEQSLLEVVDTISELKDQWQALGLALKLDPSVVKEISGTTPKDCLTKVVALWLKCGKVTPSWHSLVDCLRTGLWGDNSSIVSRIINKQPKATAVSGKCCRNRNIFIVVVSNYLETSLYPGSDIPYQPRGGRMKGRGIKDGVSMIYSQISMQIA